MGLRGVGFGRRRSSRPWRSSRSPRSNREARQRQRDRHALLRHVAEKEKIIRANDARIWLHVDGGAAHPAKDPAHEAVHQAMLNDFERLADLRDFAMRDIEIEIAGDTAVVRYRVEGRGVEAEPPPPAGGEIRFARAAKRCEMTGHRLIERR